MPHKPMPAQSPIAMAAAPRHVRVWDAPTRVFHWAFAGAFAAAWLTRDAAHLDVHEFLGYAFGALLAFRLVWGFAGTRWARFETFPLSAAGALRYLAGLASGRHRRYLGHNPAGSWTIYALLSLGVLEVGAGILALGAEKGEGPLAGRFGYRAGDLAHQAHEWIAWAMLAVVCVHLAGVLVGSLAERENLVASMLTGRKRAETSEPGVSARVRIAVAMVAMLGVGAVAWFRGTPEKAASHPLPMDATWRSECGGCHLAYHPSLLPARSWDRMLTEQSTHFGEDLALSPETVGRLRAFAAGHAAESLESPVAWKMATTIPPDAVPLRIGETPYWKERHARLDPATWKRVHDSDCGACHRDAEAGTFAPRAIAFDPGKAGKAGGG
jgi:cytochrome b